MKKLVSIVLILLLTVSVAYSLTYQIKTQVVSVATTATKLPTTPVVGREYVKVQNVGAIFVYIGSSTVTADTAGTGGIQVPPYGSWIAEFDSTIDIYGIVAAGTCNVVVEEGK